MGILTRIAVIIVLMNLVACASSPIRTQYLRFQATPKLNQNQPLAVDLIVVRDVELADALQQLSALQWMQRKQQLQRDYPLLLQVWQWEFVPNNEVTRFNLPAGAIKQAAGILLFAHYEHAGLHRARLDPFDQVLVKLGEYDMRLYANF